MHGKIMHLWLVKNKYPYVTPVQITNSMDSLSKLGLSYLGNVFSCALLTSDDMISLAIWCNMHLKLFHTPQIALALWACAILLSLKNLLVLAYLHGYI